MSVAHRIDEVIVPLRYAPGSVPPVTHVRATVLVTSQKHVREQGLESRYWQLVAGAHRGELAELVPQSWASIEAAVAHYQAIEALDIPDDAARRNGMKMMERVQGTHIGTLLRGLGGAGIVSPMMLLARSATFWDRMARGGAVAVYRVGPKEVRIENHGAPLGRFRYNNAAYEGYVQSALALVAPTVAVRHLPESSGRLTSAFRVAWA